MNRQIVEAELVYPAQHQRQVECYACHQHRIVQLPAPSIMLETERNFLIYFLVCFIMPVVVSAIVSLILLAFFTFVIDLIPMVGPWIMAGAVGTADGSLLSFEWYILFRLWPTIFVALYIITCSVYHLYLLSSITTELNIAAKGDGTRTMNIIPVIFFSIITAGIFYLFWGHTMCNRMGYELDRRNIGYVFFAETFWCWEILLNALLPLTFVGSHIFYYRLITAARRVAKNYNTNG